MFDKIRNYFKVMFLYLKENYVIEKIATSLPYVTCKVYVCPKGEDHLLIEQLPLIVEVCVEPKVFV